jgi:hypothetical protein
MKTGFARVFVDKLKNIFVPVASLVETSAGLGCQAKTTAFTRSGSNQNEFSSSEFPLIQKMMISLLLQPISFVSKVF